MAHKAASIARYIVERQASKGKTLTPMQLMKIVYICHGTHLGVYGEPLISEPVEAWAYGPVIRDLYHQLKKYGGGPVESVSKPMPNLSQSERELVDQVSDFYGEYTGIRLSKMTHMPGSPWDVTMRTRGRSAVIPDDLIAEFYVKRQRAADAAHAAGLPSMIPLVSFSTTVAPPIE